MKDTIVFLIVLMAICGVVGFWIWRKRDARKKAEWIVPFPLFDSVVRTIEDSMNASGWSKADYALNVKDCTQFAAEWRRRLARVLHPYRPEGKSEWMREFVFLRDPRPGETEQYWHRVVAVRTSVGIVYVDTYRVNGVLYRNITDTEIKTGHYE